MKRYDPRQYHQGWTWASRRAGIHVLLSITSHRFIFIVYSLHQVERTTKSSLLSGLSTAARCNLQQLRPHKPRALQGSHWRGFPVSVELFSLPVHSSLHKTFNKQLTQHAQTSFRLRSSLLHARARLILIIPSLSFILIILPMSLILRSNSLDLRRAPPQ